jgi:hypothetical protein
MFLYKNSVVKDRQLLCSIFIFGYIIIIFGLMPFLLDKRQFSTSDLLPHFFEFYFFFSKPLTWIVK